MRKSILLLVVSAILAIGSITLLCITLLWPADELQQEEPIQNRTPPFEELIGSLEEKAEEDESTDTLPTPDKIFVYAVLQESYSDQESYDKDVRESWKRLGEVLCQVAEQPTVNVYGWRQAMYQFKERTEELADVGHLETLQEDELLHKLADEIIYGYESADAHYDHRVDLLVYRMMEMLLDGSVETKHYEVARQAMKDCQVDEHQKNIELDADAFEARADFYVACYKEAERLAAEEWKERFKEKSDKSYYRKVLGQKLWNKGVHRIEEIPDAAKEYLDPLLYLPGTTDVSDIRYEYEAENISFNLLPNWRFVLRHEALGKDPIFGRYWFADKKVHLRSDGGQYYLVLKDTGSNYRYVAAESTGLTGEAAIPDEAFFAGNLRMERYPLEWLE